jgi:hypothetical protein
VASLPLQRGSRSLRTRSNRLAVCADTLAHAASIEMDDVQHPVSEVVTDGSHLLEATDEVFVAMPR